MRILLATALLIGCAAPTTQAPGAAAPRAGSGSAQGNTFSQEGDGVECHDEAPTGSLVQHKVCRDKFERDGDQRDAESFGHMARSAPSTVH